VGPDGNRMGLQLPATAAPADDEDVTTVHEGEAAMRCRECGEAAPADGPQYCGWCFGPVEVVVPPVADPIEARRVVASGPSSIARYAPLLGAGLDLAAGESGRTPLRRASALGTELGLDDLWLKDETANPTGSFKDRVVEVAAARAVALGQRVLACSSTGNLARAVAAVAARRGLANVVLVPEGLPDPEVRALAALGAHVVAVRGGYDAASRLAADAAADLEHWGWVNVTLRPWYELGGRTLGFEVAEQLGWSLPDRVVVPMASGALARALHDAAGFLVAEGLVDGVVPRLTVVQPAGCAGVAAAFESGAEDPVVVREPHTVASSLAMGDPPDGRAVLAAARVTGGVVRAVDEAAVAPAVERLRRTEAVDVEPAGGVVVAALAELAAEGVIAPGERVVAVLTGGPPRSGTSEVAGVGGGLVPGQGLAGTIEPSVSALTELLPSELRR
jgi:threonine synthase